MSDRPSGNFGGLEIDVGRRIDAVCRRFEADSLARREPRVEDYLDDVPGQARAALRIELEALERELGEASEAVARRAEAGMATSPEPHVTPLAALAESPTIAPPCAPESPARGVAVPSVHDEATVPPGADATVDLGSAPAHQPEAPSVARVRYFGEYEIIRELARGGMGVVFHAHQTTLDRPVALKMILAGQLADEADVRRFHVEAQAAAGLDHPGIVPIYEVGQHEGQHYFSMGFIEGQSLAQKVAGGPLPPREAAELLGQVAAAVQYAHERGVIHRDLKPANVLLDARGLPKVTDFGLAKKLEADSGLTASGQIMGTPSYMPPEQAAGQHDMVGPLADIYSLGAMLYCLLTARPPFQSASAMDTLLQVLEQEPVPPRQLNAGIPRDLETICLKCLEKSPARRYATALALNEDLSRYLAGVPISARPVGKTERAWRWCRRNPLVACLLAALVLLVTGVAGGASWAAIRFQKQAERQRTIAAAERRAREDADAASAVAQAQRAIALAKSAESLERLSSHLVSNGNLPRAEGDWLSCLPWYTDALAIDTDQPDRGRLHRMRLGATLRRVPRLVHLARMPLGKQESVAFAPDGLRLVGGSDGRVTNLDPLTGRRDEKRLDLPRPAGGFRLSPDGRVAVRLLERAGAKPKEVVTELLAWDVALDRPIGPAVVIAGLVSGVAFAPDGRRVATWGNPLPLQFWDLESGRQAIPEISAGLKQHLLEVQRRVVLDIEAATEITDLEKQRVGLAARLGITGREAAPASSTQLLIGEVVYSNDRRLLAMAVTIANPLVGLIKSSVHVFDAETGRPRTPPLAHPTFIRKVAFSPDGARLVTLTTGQGNTVAEARVWETASGKLLLGPLTHGDVLTGYVSVVAFSPDGRRLVTGGSTDARIWDIGKARSHDNTAPLPGGAIAVVFSPDGRSLATLSGRDGVARAWDANTLEPLTPPLRHAGTASSLRFSPDGRLLVTVGNSTAPHELEARAWDLTGDAPGTGQSLPGRWSTPDGRLVLGWQPRSARVQRKTVNQVSFQVIQRSDGSPLAPVVAPESDFQYVFHAALSADGHRLIAVLSERATSTITQVRTWDLRTDPPVGTELKQTQVVTFVALAPDGHRAATVSGDDNSGRHPSSVWLWDLASNQGKPLPVDANRNVLCVVFRPDGRRVLTVQDGLARLWDPATATAIGHPVTSPRPPSRSATAIDWIAGGRRMPPCGGFTPDGQVALFSVGDAAVHRVDAESGEPLESGPVPTRDAVQAVAVSGDSRRLIAQLADGTAQVWDVRTGRPAGPPMKPVDAGWEASVTRRISESKPAVALSADGRLALTTSPGAVHVWETETGLPIGPPLQAAAVIDGVLMCDPAIVMAFTRSNAVQIWDLSPDPTPAGDLVRLSGLLSGRRIAPDGGAASMAADDLGRAWSDLHGRRAELPERPAETAPEWHRRKAHESESTGDLFATVVHLDPLVTAAPDDTGLRKRRGEAAASLGRWAAAAADFAVVVERQPADAEARIALALLSARLGRRDDYRLACTALVAPVKRFVPSPTAISTFHAATLRPDGSDNPAALVKLLERAAKYLAQDPEFLSALAFAQYRAGHSEVARESACKSIAAYAPGA